MSEERTYTLAEARLILAREACGRSGHTYTHITTGTGALVRVVCDNCGTAWSVAPE